MILFFTQEAMRMAVEYRHGPDGQRERWVHDDPSETLQARHWTVDLAPHPRGRIQPDRVYVGTLHDVQEIAQAAQQLGRADGLQVLRPSERLEILTAPGMPRPLRHPAPTGGPFAPLEDVLGAIPRPRDSKGPYRVAVLNPGSHAYGDTLVLSTALRHVRAALEAIVEPVKIDLYQQTGSGHTRQYADSPAVDAVFELPIPLAKLAGYDAHIDLSDRYVRPGRPWVDAFLEACRVDPLTVPDAEKRNRLPSPPATHAEVQALLATPPLAGDRPRVLIHPTASTDVRSMPGTAAIRLCAAIRAACPDAALVSAVAVPGDPPDVVDASEASASFDHFLDLLRAMDAVVTVDTAPYHYADALDVPGLALFTTIPPEERIAYYPGIDGLRVGKAADLEGLHWSIDPKDLQAAATQWDSFDPAPVAAWVARRLGRSS